MAFRGPPHLTRGGSSERRVANASDEVLDLYDVLLVLSATR